METERRVAATRDVRTQLAAEGLSAEAAEAKRRAAAAQDARAQLAPGPVSVAVGGI